MTDTFTTTADDILGNSDLAGRHVVITGATGGLGLASALAFARAGANLVLIGRDADRLAAAGSAVDAAGPGTTTTERVDLADLDAVADLTDRLTRSNPQIDILVLNAGIMAAPLTRSPQGHEMQLAVSHLGHAALTKGLLDVLIASKARIVTLSSSGHWLGGYDFADPDFLERDYDKWVAYGQAKTATTLFAIALADRYGTDGITAAAVHPGVIETDLQRHLGDEEARQVLAMSADQGELRSVDAGAASIVWAAVAPEIAAHNGCYVANCTVANDLRAPHAADPADAARLWDATMELIDGTRS